MDLWKKLPEGYEIMPTMEYFKAEKKYSDATVVIFPGGGYGHLSLHEGQGYAKLLNTWGIDAFVVKYSVFPASFPMPINDARRAIQYVRANAEEYGINPEKIGVMGSSAGGHLASVTATFKDATKWPETDELNDVDFMPNFQILCYPVIDFTDEKKNHSKSKERLIGNNPDKDLPAKLTASLACDENTPPAFIWHNQDDDAVFLVNSLDYVNSLTNHGVASELHVFPNGGHGLGVATNKHCGQWTGLLLNWLKEMKIY